MSVNEGYLQELRRPLKEQAYCTDRKETKNAVTSDDALLVIEEC